MKRLLRLLIHPEIVLVPACRCGRVGAVGNPWPSDDLERLYVRHDGSLVCSACLALRVADAELLVAELALRAWLEARA